MLGLYALVLGCFSIYSYSLVDPNFTLVNLPAWELFRNTLVPLGYYHRDWSLVVYLLLLGLLFGFSFYFVKHRANPRKLAIIIILSLLLSFPFLSHDFFNYLFDAKILTFYGKNPYLFRALDFPADPWLRFMHWTHRTYPYGPVFLVATLIPSALSFGKLLIAFVLFKVLFAGAYFMAVHFLEKINRQSALLFATSPLIIIEGLVNNHNDLLGVSLAIGSLYFLIKNRRFWGSFLGGLSIGIKYFTVVFVPLWPKKPQIYLSALFLAMVLGYTYFKLGVYPWYFLNLAVYLVYLKANLWSWQVLNLGLLLSYYPYIRFGGWDLEWKVNLKEVIIFSTLLLSLVVYLWEQKLANLSQKAAVSKK
jgi:hypothetical protein